MIMHSILVAVAAFALSASVAAVDIEGVTLPDKASIAGHDVVLNGAGVRKKVVFKVYVGSLWLPQKAKDLAGVLAQSPRRIQMNLLRKLSADQLVDALVDGLDDNTNAAELEAIKPQTDALVAAMKGFGDVKDGSTVTLDFVDGATHVTLDGRERATIPGDAFNRALTRVWLGDHPAQASLKSAMLHGVAN
jgi:long-chain acyl-CoA synthetase